MSGDRWFSSSKNLKSKNREGGNKMLKGKWKKMKRSIWRSSFLGFRQREGRRSKLKTEKKYLKKMKNKRCRNSSSNKELK